MPDEKILTDFDENIDRVTKVKEFLDRIYYADSFSTLFNRPVLSLLITATRYLIDNLNELKTKYSISGS